jgi:hypothetical protein
MARGGELAGRHDLPKTHRLPRLDLGQVVAHGRAELGEWQAPLSQVDEMPGRDLQMCGGVAFP